MQRAWILALALLLGSCAAKRPAQVAASLPTASGGEAHFQSYCAACHQYDGIAGGEAPPLADSPFVTGPESRLIKIVLHGVEGEMEIQGRTYDREMPGFGQILSDPDIAALVSYVRRRFGGIGEPVQSATVSLIRAESETRSSYWQVEELLNGP